MTAEFRTRRGRIRTLAVALITLLALWSVWISGVPLAVALAMTGLVIVMAYRNLASHRTHVIRLDRNASPALNGTRGSLTSEAATSLFIALKRVAPDGSTDRAFLFRDELGEAEFRALLAYLRHG